MAKSLFAVYQDPSASAPASRAPAKSSSSRSTRKALVEAPPNDPASSSWKGKENFDPFAPTDLLSLRGPLKCAKKPSTTASGKGTSGKTVPSAKSIPPRPATSLASNNGICTGTLRTRVLPLRLPSAPKVAQTTLTSGRHRQGPVGVRRLLDSAPSSAVNLPKGRLSSKVFAPSAVVGSPSSAKDSGYGRSEASEVEEDTDDEGDSGEQDGDRMVRTVTARTKGREPTNDELNRRARSLTESPLSEVTRAFTGHGLFTIPPDSPTRRPSSLRIRTSPSHSPSSPEKHSASSTEARLMPYAVSSSTSTSAVPARKHLRRTSRAESDA